MMKITALPAFNDNYIWLLQNKNDEVVVVDPGDAQPVLDYLRDKQLKLVAILITHWHPDHIGGISKLLQMANVIVYGPASQHIPEVTHAVHENDLVEVLGVRFRVLEIPGHTLDHIAYYTQDQAAGNILFCGDTLFVGGCGRVFEGTYEQMHRSLQKLAALPPETRLYCAHEYTLSNLTFAKTVEPGNKSIDEFQQQCVIKRQNQQATVPNTLEQELRINPFLRTDKPAVIAMAKNRNDVVDSPDEVFSVLRQWKDQF